MLITYEWDTQHIKHSVRLMFGLKSTPYVATYQVGVMEKVINMGKDWL